MRSIEFKFQDFAFKPSWLGTFLIITLIPLFVHFGLWQYHKAEKKLAIQAAYNLAKQDAAMPFPQQIPSDAIDAINYKKVSVKGLYDTRFQILLDNQVEGNRVGYYVITPLRIDHTDRYVLVNRGWILGKDTHTQLPSIETPTGMQNIVGQIWVPSNKIFSLEGKVSEKDGQEFPIVWQNMNMEKYMRLVPIKVSAVLIKLDSAVQTGGFVRNWQVPPDRIATHIGYAYQWFGFALATLLIYIYMSVTRVTVKSH